MFCGYRAFYLPAGTVESIEGIEYVKALPYVHSTQLHHLAEGMHVEESWQGAIMLCLSAQKSKEFTFDTRTGRFEGRGALLLEDIDLWEFPQPQEPEDGLSAFMLAQMSRGAREAVNLIRTAVDDPNVYVLATASSEGPIEPFLLDLFRYLVFPDACRSSFFL